MKSKSVYATYKFGPKTPNLSIILTRNSSVIPGYAGKTRRMSAEHAAGSTVASALALGTIGKKDHRCLSKGQKWRMVMHKNE
jgi:hypothetical protein